MNDKIMNVMVGLWIAAILALAVVSHLAQEDIDRAQTEKKQNF